MTYLNSAVWLGAIISVILFFFLDRYYSVKFIQVNKIEHIKNLEVKFKRLIVVFLILLIAMYSTIGILFYILEEAVFRVILPLLVFSIMILSTLLFKWIVYFKVVRQKLSQ